MLRIVDHKDKYVKHFIAISIVFFIVLSSLNLPGGIFEIKADNYSPKIYIKYEVISSDGVHKITSDGYKELAGGISIDKDKVSGDSIELKIIDVKIDNTETGMSKTIHRNIPSENPGVFQLASNTYYAGSFKINVTWPTSSSNGEIQINDNTVSANKILIKQSIEDVIPDNVKNADSSLSKNDVKSLFNKQYGSESFKFKYGNSDVKDTASGKATISWDINDGTVAQSGAVTYVLTGTIGSPLPDNCYFENGDSDRIIRRTYIVGDSDYEFMELQALDPLVMTPYSDIDDIYIELPDQGVTVKNKITQTVSYNWTASIDWNEKPTTDYKPDGKEKTLTWKGTLSTLAYSPDKKDSVKISNTPKEVSITVKVLGTSSVNYVSGKVFDEIGQSYTALTGEISKALAKEIIEGQDLATKQTFYENVGQYYYFTVASVATSAEEETAIKEKAERDTSDKAKVPDTTYFDITTYLVAYNGDKLDYSSFSDAVTMEITNSKTSIPFKYTVPSEYRKKSTTSTSTSTSNSSSTYYYYSNNTYYRIYRYHEVDDNVAGVCDWKTLSSDDNKVSFSSNKFSTYAMAYYSSSSTSSSGTGGSRTNSYYIGSSSNGSPVQNTINNTGGAPKTGDDFDPGKWIFFLVVGVVVALCSFILYQDTKEWREDKKQG